jgi:hypothetical protein
VHSSHSRHLPEKTHPETRHCTLQPHLDGRDNHKSRLGLHAKHQIPIYSNKEDTCTSVVEAMSNERLPPLSPTETCCGNEVRTYSGRIARGISARKGEKRLPEHKSSSGGYARARLRTCTHTHKRTTAGMHVGRDGRTHSAKISLWPVIRCVTPYESINGLIYESKPCTSSGLQSVIHSTTSSATFCLLLGLLDMLVILFRSYDGIPDKVRL